MGYRKLQIEELYFSPDTAIQSKRTRKARQVRYIADVFFRAPPRKELGMTGESFDSPSDFFPLNGTTALCSVLAYSSVP
jgi:hypothetical protein